MDKIRRLAESLGLIEEKLFIIDYIDNELVPLKTDYSPISASFVVKTPKYEAEGLNLVVAGQYDPDVFAIMLVPKAYLESAVMLSQYFVRILKVDTSDYITLSPPEEELEDIQLENIDPNFICDRYLVTSPTDFDLNVDTSLCVKFLVGSDDNVEGELKGRDLLASIQNRTPWGESPPK